MDTDVALAIDNTLKIRWLSPAFSARSAIEHVPFQEKVSQNKDRQDEYNHFENVESSDEFAIEWLISRGTWW